MNAPIWARAPAAAKSCRKRQPAASITASGRTAYCSCTRDCSFAPQGAAPAGGITVFTAATRATKEKPKQGEPPARQIKAA